MNKKQATFISGIICSKGLDLKRYINGNRLQEWTVIDLGLDLAAKQQPTADLQRSASQPTRKDCPGCSWPRGWSATISSPFITRTYQDKNEV